VKSQIRLEPSVKRSFVITCTVMYFKIKYCCFLY